MSRFENDILPSAAPSPIIDSGKGPGPLTKMSVKGAGAGGAQEGRSGPVDGATMIFVDMIGGFALSVDGETRQPTSRKLKAIIAYLCLQRTASESRERLAGLLWSESDSERARNSLRQSVAELRLLLGEKAGGSITSSRLVLGLARDALACDLDEVIADAERGIAHDKLLDAAQPIEALLADIEDIDPEFRVWLKAKRSAIADRLLRALDKTLGASGPLSEAQERNARAMLAIDGTHEVAARALITHYARSGAEARAQQVYNDLWRLLDEVYDTEPSPETQSLIADVKRGVIAGSPAPQARGALSIGLFVGRLDPDGASAESRVRMLAFRLQLIASLVRFREWRVFDEADFVRHRESDGEATRYFRLDLAPIGDLGIGVTLKDAASGRVLWSEIPQLESGGWSDSHVRTIKRLANALNVQVSSAQLSRIEEWRGIPRDLYDRWLNAYTKLMDYAVTEWDRSLDELRGVVAEAPDFSPGFRSLAQWENARHIARPGVRRSRERHLRTLDIAKRAVELDPVDSRAHLCLAWSLALVDQPADARAHADIAIELNDGDPWTLISGANIVGFSGDVRAAVAAADSAMAATPLHSRAHLAYDAHVRFMAGDESACLNALELAQNSGYPGVGAWRIAALAQLGAFDDAASALDAVIADLRRQWTPGAPAHDQAVFDWLADQFPIADRAVAARLYGGLATARDRLARRRYWQTDSV